MNKKGALIISLDFELFWGIFDKYKLIDKVDYFDNTLAVIPEILNLFKEFEIEATWATVGGLFNTSFSELTKRSQNVEVNYNNKNLSSHLLFRENTFKKEHDKYFIAPNLLKLISEVKGQEIGTHTYSHYYCLEKGQTKKDFDDDLKIHIKLSKEISLNLKSIVLPRNQYNSAYNEVCITNGIETLRINPSNWFWDSLRKESLIKKIFRTLDCYIPLSKTQFELNNLRQVDSKLFLIPASRFLRPFSNYRLLNKLKIIRIKNEMSYAAKNNLCYHLWWHPHNFGDNPQKAIIELRIILLHYQFLREKYDMKSLNMINTANYYNNDI